MLNSNKKILANRLKRKIDSWLESSFNRSRLDRNPVAQIALGPIERQDYWASVGRRIKEVSETQERSFFHDPVVILHLASENYRLGYRLIEKIYAHPLGQDLLNRCGTPSWGSPYLLRKYPFLSPTTASHIANLLSIYDHFGSRFSSILDFGGGYGGLARCISQVGDVKNIYVCDIPDMIDVQRRYLEKTLESHKVEFFSDINILECEFNIFNASFSFSEMPIEDRLKVEDQIIKYAGAAHIIFQPSFNGVDNEQHMNKFKCRLKASGWKAIIIKYEMYDVSEPQPSLLVAARPGIKFGGISEFS
jgi:hypothetical protein